MTDQEILVKAIRLSSELEFVWCELRSGSEFKTVDGELREYDWVEFLFSEPRAKVAYVMTAYSELPDQPESERLVLIGKLTAVDLEDMTTDEFFKTITDLEAKLASKNK